MSPKLYIRNHIERIASFKNKMKDELITCNQMQVFKTFTLMITDAI